ncbi:hypothetical protein D3C75_949240 [compost metagenome]
MRRSAIATGLEPTGLHQCTGGQTRIEAGAQFAVECLLQHHVLGEAHFIEAAEARAIAHRQRTMHRPELLQTALAMGLEERTHA